MKIGLFDSGLGGLTIVQALLSQLKGVELIYIADTKNAPYGEKSSEEILSFSFSLTHYLIEHYQIELLVVACNSATSASIASLRASFPQLLIVGTEPAIKPAFEQSRRGVVGVLATLATLQGEKYRALVRGLLQDSSVRLYEQACIGLVEHIEGGTLQSRACRRLLESWLIPFREQGVDTIVLGCTHYPLAKEEMAKIMGKDTLFLDSGEAIAKRVLTLLLQRGHHNEGEVRLQLFCTGVISQKSVSQILPEATIVQLPL